MADLPARLGALLDAAVSALAAGSIPAPDRRFVTLSPVTADCELLAVSFARAYRGEVGRETTDPRECGPGRVVDADLVVVRCWPTSDSGGRPPAAQDVTDASDRALTDAYALTTKLGANFHAPQGGIVVGAWTPVSPSGGLGGVSVRVTFRHVG